MPKIHRPKVSVPSPARLNKAEVKAPEAKSTRAPALHPTGWQPGAQRARANHKPALSGEHPRLRQLHSRPDPIGGGGRPAVAARHSLPRASPLPPAVARDALAVAPRLGLETAPRPGIG